MRKHPIIVLVIAVLSTLAIVGLAGGGKQGNSVRDRIALSATSDSHASHSGPASQRALLASATAFVTNPHPFILTSAIQRGSAGKKKHHHHARRAHRRRHHRIRTKVHPKVTPAEVPATGVWASLRNCESGGNYHEDTGNGYYGAYQFSLSTWHALGFHSDPDAASITEQDTAARTLRNLEGWRAWPMCSAHLGLA